ncbi:GIY-YIG nuclease family protein [Shewanella sp. 10N.286.51.B8]|uniref:GIY-YIG nuclease family protein n=1 Tax=Shewanella sp. 10N.286.51.B8 TaxID=3229708 RepID=UPI00354F492C
MEKHTILYIMRSVHLDGRILVNDKKIGVTGKGNATLRSRISQLSSTKNNFGAQCIAAWNIDKEDSNSALHYEKQLHALFQKQVVPCTTGNKTEWFYDDGGNQIDIIETVSSLADKWKLNPVDVYKLQDANAKLLAIRATKASFEQVLSVVKTFTSAKIMSSALTKDCVRITTDDKRSFHINVRADLNKQYISISKTKNDHKRFEKMCNEHQLKWEISNKSGNIRVYVKSPRDIAKILDIFYDEGI